MKTTTISHVAIAILENWTMPYRIFNVILTDSGIQLTPKLLTAICTSIETNYFTTTKYHLQSSKKEE